MHAMSNSYVLGPVCYQPPSLNGDVITWRKKPGLTAAGPLHCAAAATTATTGAPAAYRHRASFTYDFSPEEVGEKVAQKHYIGPRKALIDCAEVVFDWE